ncbi:MAG: GntG family PLP-dependent aldolase, partial [Candidatus Bathyarchaeia archaeon]
NTHNRAGGTIITPQQIEALSKVTKEHGLKLYMDGARIFNAAVALKVDVREFTRHVDNLMFCLSKGLSCPVGSLVVGDSDFIERARKTRKILGGGMRQAGIIAAPGIIALEKMIDRLEEDHVNARILAEGIAKIDGLYVDLRRVQTNIVLVDVSGLGVDANTFIAELKKHGLLASYHSKTIVRMVTHYGIVKEHIEKALSIIEDVTKYLRDQVNS